MDVAALAAAAAAASAYLCLAARQPPPVPDGEGFEAVGNAPGGAAAYIAQLRRDDSAAAGGGVALARALDRRDRLAVFRKQFYFPQRDGGAAVGSGTQACRYFVGASAKPSPAQKPLRPVLPAPLCRRSMFSGVT